MSETLICCAYAENENMRSGENVIKVNDKRNLYIKNAFVALYSAKVFNKDLDVALITNVVLPDYYKELFNKYSIKIIYQEFNSFVFDDKIKWGLAFYKLCAIKRILDENYKYYVMMDTDVVVQTPMDDFLLEIKHYLMLYERFARCSYKEEVLFDSEARMVTDDEGSLIKYGGELIGGPRDVLYDFIGECENLFIKLKKSNFYTNFGDEFITSIVSRKFRLCIKEANSYIERFWTGTFRQVNINYYHNPVSILHVPAEKNDGMIKIFEYIIKYDSMPTRKKLHHMLHLCNPSLITRIKIIIKSIKKKIGG